MPFDVGAAFILFRAQDDEILHGTGFIAVAIAEQLTPTQVTTAGVWMGIFLLLLSISNGIEWLNRFIPTAVVSGIQMGVGINLAIRGILLVQALSWLQGPDCILLSIVCAILSLYLLREQPPRVSPVEEGQQQQQQQQQQPQSAPVGLYLFGLGVLLALVKLYISSTDATNP